MGSVSRLVCQGGSYYPATNASLSVVDVVCVAHGNDGAKLVDFLGDDLKLCKEGKFCVTS